jgi:hypothetical protein
MTTDYRSVMSKTQSFDSNVRHSRTYDPLHVQRIAYKERGRYVVADRQALRARGSGTLGPHVQAHG